MSYNMKVENFLDLQTKLNPEDNSITVLSRVLSKGPVYSDTTQLNSTASCRSRSADGASAILNVVTQLK